MKTEIGLAEETEPLGISAEQSVFYGKVCKKLIFHDYEFDDNTTTLVSKKVQLFRHHFYPEVTDAEWNNWHWQVRNRIAHLSELERILVISDDEREAFRMRGKLFPFAVTPYYASLLDPDNSEQPLRRTVIPVANELVYSLGETEDPLAEDCTSPVAGIVHRYPDRVLFLVTDFCSTYCRYCTRSRIVGKVNIHKYNTEKWSQAISYIADNPNVRDVLLSGGDPLTMSDAKLEWLLSCLRKIPHVEILRIGTKAPVVLPQRITPKLVKMLKRYHPLWMSIHFTHPDELTPEVQAACKMLADAGIPLQSQTVLLSGINDTTETLTQLFHGLVSIRVRPYYLYQCDPIVGSAHFRTPVQKGLDIIAGLRGYTTGFAVPNYVIDAPGGGGKIPLLPDYVVGRQGNELVLRNYERKIFRYYDSGEKPAFCQNRKKA